MIDIRSSIPSTNYGSGRGGTTIDTLVFHHIVGDAPAAYGRFRQSGVQVSSTYIIGSDGQVYYTVSEGNTPYTNGSYDWNRRSITIEHAGGTSSVPYTEAMYQASILLCRDIMKRYNITQIKRHRDLVATACPGGLDVERIVREAKQGGNEVIGAHSVNSLRIAHSEVGGWDLNRTHKGEFDKLFLDAWNGRSYDEMLYTQWINGGAYRAAKESQKKAIADLNAALAGSKAELEAAKTQLQTANATVEAERKKATEAGIAASKLEAEKQADTATGNSFLRWIGNILRGGN